MYRHKVVIKRYNRSKGLYDNFFGMGAFPLSLAYNKVYGLVSFYLEASILFRQFGFYYSHNLIFRKKSGLYNIRIYLFDGSFLVPYYKSKHKGKNRRAINIFDYFKYRVWGKYARRVSHVKTGVGLSKFLQRDFCFYVREEYFSYYSFFLRKCRFLREIRDIKWYASLKSGNTFQKRRRRKRARFFKNKYLTKKRFSFSVSQQKGRFSWWRWFCWGDRFSIYYDAKQTLFTTPLCGSLVSNNGSVFGMSLVNYLGKREYTTWRRISRYKGRLRLGSRYAVRKSVGSLLQKRKVVLYNRQATLYNLLNEVSLVSVKHSICNLLYYVIKQDLYRLLKVGFNLEFSFLRRSALTAKLLSEFLCLGLVGGKNIKHLVKFFGKLVVTAPGFLGYRIECSGRFTNKQRKDIHRFSGGVVPWTKKDVVVDFFLREVILKYGTCGIKVWIYYSKDFLVSCAGFIEKRGSHSIIKKS